MFDWLFKRAEKEESLLEIITSTTQQLQLYEFAKEKAIGMIADAIAKSEIVVQRKGARRIQLGICSGSYRGCWRTDHSWI